MIASIKGRYIQQRIELYAPLNLNEGDVVELQLISSSSVDDREAFAALGMERLEAEWNNPQDAIYDNWKELYADQLS